MCGTPKFVGIINGIAIKGYEGITSAAWPLLRSDRLAGALLAPMGGATGNSTFPNSLLAAPNLAVQSAGAATGGLFYRT